MNNKPENDKTTEEPTGDERKSSVVRSDARQCKDGTYNEWCEKQNCDQYIMWEYSTGLNEQPYLCISCKLQGQSHDITEIAKDCPHK